MLKGTRRHLSSARTNELENNIKMYAHLLADEEMLLNIRNIGFVEKEVHYHAICRSRYQRKKKYTTMQYVGPGIRGKRSTLPCNM